MRAGRGSGECRSCFWSAPTDRMSLEAAAVAVVAEKAARSWGPNEGGWLGGGLPPLGTKAATVADAAYQKWCSCVARLLLRVVDRGRMLPVFSGVPRRLRGQISKIVPVPPLVAPPHWRATLGATLLFHFLKSERGGGFSESWKSCTQPSSPYEAFRRPKTITSIFRLKTRNNYVCPPKGIRRPSGKAFYLQKAF